MKTIKIEDSTHKALKIFCANYSRNMSVEADYAILDHIDVEEKKSIKQKIKKKPNDTIPTNHPTNKRCHR